MLIGMVSALFRVKDTVPVKFSQAAVEVWPSTRSTIPIKLINPAHLIE
ncbi:MAG: hypothetical protein RIF36_00545 [Imperialibacter sp.]